MEPYFSYIKNVEKKYINFPQSRISQKRFYLYTTLFFISCALAFFFLCNWEPLIYKTPFPTKSPLVSFFSRITHENKMQALTICSTSTTPPLKFLTFTTPNLFSAKHLPFLGRRKLCCDVVSHLPVPPTPR